LIIEVDGPVHETQKEYDAMRQSFLESLGYRVLRFTNEQVLQDIQAVLPVIQAALEPHPLSPSPQAGKGTTPPRPRRRRSPPPRPRRRRSPPPRPRRRRSPPPRPRSRRSPPPRPRRRRSPPPRPRRRRSPPPRVRLKGGGFRAISGIGTGHRYAWLRCHLFWARAPGATTSGPNNALAPATSAGADLPPAGAG
jgi:hypothetical protein